MHLYVGSRTTRERDARGLGLSVYDVNDGLDRWQRLQVIEAVNPSFLALSEDGRMLYAVHGDQTSVSSYAVELDGRLQFLNRRSAGGRNPVHLHLSADGRRLLVASYANGLLSCLPVLADGSLAEIASTLAFEGEPGPHRVEQRGSHPHQVLRLSETDLYVVPDKGLDRVHLVRLASDGALHLVQSAVMRSGSGPRPDPWHCADPVAALPERLAERARLAFCAPRQPDPA